jgi:hypothetical protein
VPGAGPDGAGATAIDGGSVLVPAARRLGLGGWRAGVALALAGVLAVGGLVAGALALRDVARNRSDVVRATPLSPDRAALARVEDAVLELEGEVARARGLRFIAPVRVRVLSPGAFLGRLRAASTAGAVDLAAREDTLRALRLLPAGADLALTEEAARARVVGFYDPRTKELYVRGTTITAYVRFVVVHELTHALQDQNFGLARRPLDNDAALAERAVAEGDAQRTAQAYASTLPAAAQETIRRRSAVRTADLYSAAYHAGVEAFPYVAGVAFVDAVRAAGGQAALDDALRNPPLSSAEIIHPDRYLARVEPEVVPAPEADGPVVDRGVLGEYQLVHVLARAIDDQDALDIASAWGGSRYVTWRSAGRTCTRARFTMLSPAADQALAAALGVWAETTGATVEGSGPVTLTTCIAGP